MIKLWLVAVYEYRRNVFKRSFILALLSVPLMIALNVGVGLYMESRGNDDAPVGYVDHAGLFADPIPVPVSGSREPVEFVPFQTEEDARAALESGQIQAFFVVAADYGETRDMTLFYLEEPGGNATRQFYDFIQVNLLATSRRYRAPGGPDRRRGHGALAGWPPRGPQRRADLWPHHAPADRVRLSLPAPDECRDT